MTTTVPDAKLKQAVVRVNGGRGFIIEADKRRLVITAAHCLPTPPPCHGGSYTEERTYAKLLGKLGGSEPTVWAECLFADPIADIAVLGSPDNQALYDEALDYEALTEDVPFLPIGEPVGNTAAWLLTLDGDWMKCVVRLPGGRAIYIDDAEDDIEAGMSGSPILNHDGTAVGVVCMNENSFNPRLTYDLPGWLLRSIVPPNSA